MMKKIWGVSLWGLLGSIMLFTSGCETAQERELKQENVRLTSINLVHTREAADLRRKLEYLSSTKNLSQEEIDGLKRERDFLKDRLSKRPTIRKNVLDSRMRAKLMNIAAAIGGELVGNKILLPGDFLFASGSWGLRNEAKGMLRELSSVLGPEKFGLMIVGHTDNEPIKKLRRKGISSNRQLSMMRSLAVVEYLESSSCKYPRALIYPAGWGELQPVASNKTKQGQAANRRVEIFIDPDLSNLTTNSAIIDVAPAPEGAYRAAPAPLVSPAPVRFDAVEPEEAEPAPRSLPSRWEK